MKKRTFYLLVLCFCLAGSLFAQEVSTYAVYFVNSSNTQKGDFDSDTFRVDQNQERLPFIGISAYCLVESLDVDLFYRVWTDRKVSEWVPFNKFTEGELLGRTTFEGPAILRPISAIQFRANKHMEEKIVFRLYFPRSQTLKTPEEERDRTHENTTVVPYSETSCNCDQPAICKRNCWCPSGNCPPDPTPVSTMPTHIIVHHSAGFNSSSDFRAVVAYYWDLHVNTNGWDDIGYNWLIDAQGTVYEGRGDGRLGAHFSCMNGNTIGICLIGNFQTVAPTDRAIAVLKEWLAWEACHKAIDLTEADTHAPSQMKLRHVSGHRDGNGSSAPNSCAVGTVCPGNRLYEQLDMIAKEADAFACLNAVPDLVILEMWTVPAQPVAGDTVDLYVSFKNTGAAIAQGIRWDYRIAGTTVSRDSLTLLEAGATQTRVLNNYIFPGEGVFSFCIYADAVAGESNSLNNSFCLDISVSGTSAGNEEDIADRFVVYPNPSDGFIHAEVIYKTPPRELIVQLINVHGQVVYEKKDICRNREWKLFIRLTDISQGTYFLKINSASGILTRTVFVF